MLGCCRATGIPVFSGVEENQLAAVRDQVKLGGSQRPQTFRSEPGRPPHQKDFPDPEALAARRNGEMGQTFQSFEVLQARPGLLQEVFGGGSVGRKNGKGGTTMDPQKKREAQKPNPHSFFFSFCTFLIFSFNSVFFGSICRALSYISRALSNILLWA